MWIRAWRWKSSRLVLLGEKDNQKIPLRPDGFHGYCLKHDVCAGAIKPKRRSKDHFLGKDMFTLLFMTDASDGDKRKK